MLNIVGLRWNDALHNYFLGLFFGWGAEMSKFEILEALAVRPKLSCDFAGVIIPFLGRSEADAESGVVLGVVEIYDLSEDSHEG